MDPKSQENASPEKQAPKQIKGRAIVTYGRSLISLVIARSLHEHGIDVIGCDDVGMTVLSFSKHVSDNFVHTPFEEDEEKALNEFEAAVRKNAPSDNRPYVLIPAFRDARIFARHRDRFEPLIKISAPDASSIDLIDPKDAFARFAKKHELDIPDTRIVIPSKRDEEDFSDVEYPCIMKPAVGVGGRGVEKIDSEEELNAYLENASSKEPILIQQMVDGEDYCVSVIADHGKLAGVVAYRNIRQFPVKSGAGAIRETIDAEPFLEATRKLLELTKWNGVSEIDFRWNGDPDIPPKIIEINPRYWAGLFHSTASGVDFPWLAFNLAAGRSLTDEDSGEVQVGFRTKTPAAWLLSIIEETAASDEHLKKSGEAWSEMKDHASKGHIIQAATKLMESAGHGVAAPGMLTKLQEELSKHDDLPSEFSSDNDPAVGLGILFALSSLRRHGTLPPELKFDTPKKEDDEDEGSSPPKHHEKPAKRDKPIIGITKPDKGDYFSFLAMKFAVWLAGGKPIRITSQAPRDPHSVDGLLFGGGSDVYPERYQGLVKENHNYDRARDEMEASWAKAAMHHDLPVFGVCRGMQMLNVLQGGTLSSDLSNYNDIRYPTTFLRRIFFRKTIAIKEDSWLSRITGRRLLSVNSIHTQAIRELGSGFKPSAREINGLIQSIEHQKASFMVGVQFHPELLIHKPFARRIFKEFVGAAYKRHLERRAQTVAEQSFKPYSESEGEPSDKAPASHQ
tara:strand:+ start:11823 stop:14027 length:2205 start_codon:yes stop_codon:yes gene_type:complete